MRQVAIYGKGGIGKSTTTQNLTQCIIDEIDLVEPYLQYMLTPYTINYNPLTAICNSTKQHHVNNKSTDQQLTQ